MTFSIEDEDGFSMSKNSKIPHMRVAALLVSVA